MRRRDFLTFLGCAAAWVSTARGEEPLHVVGFLSAFFAPGMPGALAAFYQGLKETGFFEGKNISVEFRWADGRYDRLPSLAAELVGRNVSVIWANDLPSAFAALRAYPVDRRLEVLERDVDQAARAGPRPRSGRARARRRANSGSRRLFDRLVVTGEQKGLFRSPFRAV